MELKVFSIHDKATDAFNIPFFMLTKSEAIRAFTLMAEDETTNINKFPEDYTLYQIGKFDNHNGVIDQSYGVERVLTGLDAKRGKETLEELKKGSELFPAKDIDEMKAITS